MAVKFTRVDLEFLIQQILMAENNILPDSPHLAFGLRKVSGEDNSTVPGQGTFGATDEIFPHMTDSVFRVITVDASILNGTALQGAFGPGATITSNYAITTGPLNNIVDPAPRIISNLIVDQTANNPAAVAAAAAAADVLGTGYQYIHNPTQANPVASDGSLFINNVTPDAGLSAPFNSLFTFFGQFFDHGLDLINKGGNGTVFVPLAADDPLRTLGPDGIAGTGDEVPDSLAFMVLTRATDTAVSAGPDGQLGTSDDIHYGTNLITPFVDQSQTYGSVASQQVFLREYANNPVTGRPYATGRLLSHLNADGSHTMATWADVKANALRIGIALNDTTDLVSIPLVEVDDYGNFIPSPSGLARLVTSVGADGRVGTSDDTSVAGSITLNPGNVLNPFSINAISTGGVGGALRTGHAFLNDIAASADPVNHQGPGFLVGASDGVINDTNNNGIIDNGETPLAAGTFDLDLLNAHYIAGDGRVNENIGLTAVHEIFHDEHNRLIDQIKALVVSELAKGDASFAAQWTVPGANLADGIQDGEWNGNRLFQAAKFGTETQYQHLVFEEFARKVAPTIHLFGNNDITLDAAITSEFANVVYRFGHSMLDENVNRYVIHDGGPGDPLNGTAELYKLYTDADTGAQTDSTVSSVTGVANAANDANIVGTPVLNEISLIGAFTNPIEYLSHGGDAAAEIILGSANQVGNEIDEFVTGALRNNLLGLPLDLAALNLARGRDVGVAGLNVVRNQLYSQAPTANQTNAAFHDTQLKPYASWDEFGQFLKHASSLINFVAAYGTHESVTSHTTLIDKRAAAYDLVVEAQTSVAITPLYVDANGHLTNLEYTDANLKHTSFVFTDGAGHYTDYGYLDGAGNASAVDSGNGLVAGMTMNALNAANPDVNAGQPSVDANGASVPLANPDFVQDAYNFLHSTGAYVNNIGSALAVHSEWSTGSVTGLDDVDLWVGGLAEKQALFGGLLGTTFNYIFETQLESLQDGDRLYYLPRIEGMDFGTQIENNSFAELIIANTKIKHLSASIFLTPEYVVEAANYFQKDANGAFLLDVNGNRIATDSSTWLHNAESGALLVEVLADNTVHFIGDDNFFGNTMVLGGTEGNDSLLAGQADDDTVWGDGGDDTLDGGGGNDFIYGGTGDDLISDSAGDDVIHGDDGDDTINAGVGDDIVFGGDGNDYIEGGAGIDDLNGGLGNDIMLGGEDDDEMLGNEGDDWMEGGDGADILVGDQGAATGQVPMVSGNDVLIGGLQGDKMQGFSGDDIMLGQGGFDKFLGELGFDWGSYEKEDHGVDVDMTLRLFIPNPNQPAGDAIRDFWVSTEGVSGTQFDDDLKGEVGGIVDPLNELANTALINGLQDGANGLDKNFFAPGQDVHYSEGNIMLGGGGSDRIMGDHFARLAAANQVPVAAILNGGQDIIDGDAWLHVELMQGYQAGSPILREIVYGNLDGSADTRATDVDTAVYNDVIGNYTIRYDSDGDGVLTVLDNVISAENASDILLQGDARGFVQIIHTPLNNGISGVNDGTDMVRNIERLEFFDRSVELNVAGNIALTTAGALFNGGFGANRIGVVQGGSLAITDNSAGTPAAPVISDVLSFNNANRPNFGITDADGIVGGVHLQWQYQSVAHPGWSNITGATNATFTVTDVLLGETIRVVASYTDGKGHHEQVLSDITGVVVANPAVNHAPFIQQQTNPVGLPDTTALEDKGLGGIPAPGGPAGLSQGIFLSFDQVFADDNTPLTPGGLVYTAAVVLANGTTVAINAPGGAANAAGLFFDTNTVNAAGNQVGHLYSLSTGVGGPNFAGPVNVRITATDAQGLSVTDTFVINVLAQDDGKATFLVNGSRLVGGTVHVAELTPDPDGGLKPGTAYKYQWLSDGVAIAGQTGADYIVKAGDSAHTIAVRTTYTDAQGFKETVVTDAGIHQVPATGAAVISNLVPREGQTLSVSTATIADLNGLGAFSFQWQSSTNGVTFTNIGGATAATFAIPDLPGTGITALAGQQLRVVTTFTDGLGVLETVTSAATGPVGINWDGSASGVGLTFSGNAGSDLAVGTSLADTLRGRDGNDFLLGGAGNDTISGDNGDDVITGGAGNDSIFGNAGTDTAVYLSPVTNYRFDTTGNVPLTITDLVGNEGTDSVDQSVEIMRIGGIDYTILRDTNSGNTVDGGLGSQIIFGRNGNDNINGGAGNFSDIIMGGVGNDTINGGNGDDFIFQTGATDGHDIINGSFGVDTYILNGVAGAEQFHIYTRAAFLAVAGNAGTALAAGTEIVITRNNTNAASIIAELDNVEEIKINSLDVTANNGGGLDTGTSEGDTITVAGNFNTTSLLFSTITVAGSQANDTVDITGLSSDHRIVFNSNGGLDTILGATRPQDVFTGSTFLDERTGAAAFAASPSAANAAGDMIVAPPALESFGAADGLSSLLGGLSRHEFFGKHYFTMPLVSSHRGGIFSIDPEMHGISPDGMDFVDMLAHVGLLGEEHSLSRTIVNNPSDLQPLGLAEAAHVQPIFGKGILHGLIDENIVGRDHGIHDFIL